MGLVAEGRLAVHSMSIGAGVLLAAGEWKEVVAGVEEPALVPSGVTGLSKTAGLCS